MCAKRGHTLNLMKSVSGILNILACRVKRDPVRSFMIGVREVLKCESSKVLKLSKRKERLERGKSKGNA
jgi:hypothetical protein